jgi:hypothetical protein
MFLKEGIYYDTVIIYNFCTRITRFIPILIP